MEWNKKYHYDTKIENDDHYCTYRKNIVITQKDKNHDFTVETDTKQSILKES